MGVFREDERTRVSRLVLFWMAEGFVQCSDERIPEEVVEGYMMDLISSSLIMVSKTTFNGKVKYLQIHDLVRDFVLKKAKEEKFMQVIGSHNQYQPLYDGGQRVCIHLDKKIHTSNSSLDILLRRVSTKGMSFGPDHKSVFVTKKRIDFLYYPISNSTLIFSSLSDLRLLRVLDLMNCILKDYQDILQSLVHLRYLRTRCEEFHFDWVSHLCQLETLLVDSGSLVDMSPAFWNMTKLRHVNVGSSYCKLACEEPSNKLENLRTFEGLGLLCEDNIEEEIESFPSLEKLKLIVVSVNDEVDSLFLKLEVLTKLQSLSLSFEFVRPNITEFYYPSSLKELFLHQAHLGAASTLSIARLPNLEKLKIAECVFEQNERDVRDVEFPVLKILKFQEVLESSFLVLEILVLKDSQELDKIPDSFVDVQTLKSIKVISGQKSLKTSALEIKVEVEAITGCDNLKVYISSPYFWEKLEEENEEAAEPKVEAEEKEEGEEEELQGRNEVNT